MCIGVVAEILCICDVYLLPAMPVVLCIVASRRLTQVGQTTSQPTVAYSKTWWLSRFACCAGTEHVLCPRTSGKHRRRTRQLSAFRPFVLLIASCPHRSAPQPFFVFAGSANLNTPSGIDSGSTNDDSRCAPAHSERGTLHPCCAATSNT